MPAHEIYTWDACVKQCPTKCSPLQNPTTSQAIYKKNGVKSSHPSSPFNSPNEHWVCAQFFTKEAFDPVVYETNWSTPLLTTSYDF